MKTNTTHGKSLLEVENLVVSYYKKEILFGANLSVMPGEIVALVGANGSGKSTLLKTIAGLIKSKSGRIFFDGVEITNKDSYELAPLGIGLLLQGGVVFPSLTIIEHLQLANRALAKLDFEQRVDVVWNTFPALYPIRNKRAGVLSGGERQMLGFSNLLIQKARLWLLDEPTGGLAPEMSEVLWDTLGRLNSEEAVTVLLAEQNLDGALKASSRVYVIRNGLAYEEMPQNILNSQNLEGFFFAETGS